LSAVFCFGFSFTARATTSLEELYSLAKDYNPTVERAELQKTLQEKRLKELKTAFFPTLSLNGTYFYGNVPIGAEVGQSGLERIDTQNAINLSTTLYGGGAEYTYFKYKHILPELAKNQKDSLLFNFFLQLNAFYFNYLNQNKQHTLLQRQVKSLKKRIDILKRWGNIGRVRKADYFATLSQLKSIESLTQQALENKNVAQLNLKALSGVTVELDNDEINFNKYYSLPKGWDLNAKERPEYKVLESSIENQIQNITIAKSQLRPQVNFFSNAYINRRQFGRQDEWDVGISLTWNFFDFGATNSRVDQQEVLLNQLKTDLENTEITLNNEMKVLETQFLSQIKRKKFLEEALEAANKNLKEQQREYDKGLVTALDVNQSLEQFINAELSLETLKHSIAEQWYALKLLSGDIEL
jgi:outer membrane protein TolC